MHVQQYHITASHVVQIHIDTVSRFRVRSSLVMRLLFRTSEKQYKEAFAAAVDRDFLTL